MSVFHEVCSMEHYLGYLLEMQTSELKLRPTQLEPIMMEYRYL